MPSQVLKVLRFDRGERTEISPSCEFSGEGSAHKPTEGAEFHLALPENQIMENANQKRPRKIKLWLHPDAAGQSRSVYGVIM